MAMPQLETVTDEEWRDIPGEYSGLFCVDMCHLGFSSSTPF